MNESNSTSNIISKSLIDNKYPNHLNPILIKLLIFAKNNFAKFCALLSAVNVIFFWYIRTIAYCYQSGIFREYTINSDYIVINDNFIFQLIQYMAVFILIALSNIILIHIKLYPQKLLRSIINVFLFFILEIVLVCIIACFFTYSDINQMLLNIKGTSFSTWIALLLIFALWVVVINIFAIEIIFFSKHTKTKNEDSQTKTVSKDTDKLFFIIPVIVAAFLLPLSYVLGVHNERNKISYKIVNENISASNCYCPIYKNNTNDKNTHLCAVVYENDSIYILCPIYRNQSESYINKTITMIIDKKNIITYQCDDISNITPISP